MSDDLLQSIDPIQTMPGERAGRTFKFCIHALQDGMPFDQEGYLNVGVFPDGRAGEIFIKMAKQGSETSGWADSFAIAVSMLLQRGVPLEDVIAKFKARRFEPSGMTDTPGIPFATSPVDLICRILEMKCLPLEENK